ncbi:MAG: neutral/alkaline non-lysosomal ceramidase N-terminal domain-containing protein [Bacteroidales bacterium]|nr:neutral/alkaline non-lysosomal ceramidase N-terminal domain-containing protein [Bacteroidales bacterium]
MTLLTTVFGFSPIPAAEPSWKAGFAQVAITPTEPMWMSGYASRTAPANGAETELWAKAAVLEDAAGKRAVLITLDLVGISRDISHDVCQLIMNKYRLPREAIALSTSHTHCGPVVGKTLRSMYFINDAESQKIITYTTKLPAKLLTAVDAAVAKLEPVTLGYAVGQAGFAVNRRENKEADVPKLRAAGTPLKGPNDHDVPVLAARNVKGQLTGVVFGYACHATTLGFQKWCGDYPGFAMMNLEKSHPGSVALFFAGCGADQNPIPRRTVELARNYGQQLASAVDTVLAKPLTPLQPTFTAAYQEIQLALAHIPNRDELIQQSLDKNKYIAARAKMLLKDLETQDKLPPAYPYPVQTWRLGGELNLVTLGGEVVVDYSLRLKKELGPKTWVMGYANDVMAYIPSHRVLKEGGYEGATSMIYYGLPSPWAQGIEDRIIAEVHRQSQKLRGK